MRKKFRYVLGNTMLWLIQFLNYEEHMASKISEMKSNLSETAGAVSDSYKGSLLAQFGITLDTNH